MTGGPAVRITYDHGVQVALGERKYSTYMEALNESIQNSFDNRATCVSVDISPDRITVEDDGTGLDERRLNEDYLRIGKRNVDPGKAGLFGIGCLGQRALSGRTEIISHVLGNTQGIRVVLDWGAGPDHQVESTAWIDSPVEKHGTLIALTDLKYRPSDPSELRRYLQQKHFPRLMNAKGLIHLHVNGIACQTAVPTHEVMYEFDSTKPFVVGDKSVPAVPDASFGNVKGTIYVTQPDKDNTTHVYDRLGSRLDSYAERDWLRINSLTSGGAFRMRILAVISTATETVIDSVPGGRFLLIKSDRGGFFEEVPSYRAFVEYLNGKPGKAELNLPDGGVLRLIHAEWLKTYQAQKEQKFDRDSDEAVREATSILNEVLKDEDTVWKTDPEGEEESKPRKTSKQDGTRTKCRQPARKRLLCPECTAFNYISLVEYKVFVQNPNPKAKEQMKKNWPCKVCGYYLNPETDLHRIQSPPKKPGTVVARVKIGKGTWVDIQHQGLGASGDIAVCDITDEFIHVNNEHALFRRAYGIGKETLQQHVITAVLYAVAKAKEGEQQADFEQEFNKMCSHLHHVVEGKKPKKHSIEESDPLG